MEPQKDQGELQESELAKLAPLAREIPNIDSAIAEIARFSAELTLPRGTIHVISDIHGEDKKLRHVINNASGTLRPLVERLLKDRMPPEQFQEILTLVFYPAEVIDRLEQTLTSEKERKDYATRTLHDLFHIVRVLAARRSLKHSMRVFPDEYRELLAEILHEPSTERDRSYVDAIVDELTRRGRVLHLIHLTGRVIRNLAIDELIIGGDAWDRGPRGDRVMDYIMQQPNVSFVWGNHDVEWLGACLGHRALTCQVLRISLRYRRLTQLEEGYGIPVQPLDATPPPIPLGIPSQLLERRPDIAAAERLVAQANAQIGIARAAYFPTVTLSAAAGLESTSITNWFTWPSRFFSVGPAVAETNIKVVTRSLEPLRQASAGQPNPVVGADFQFTLEPSHVVEGTVRDAGTGQPLAGVRVQSWRMANDRIANDSPSHRSSGRKHHKKYRR